MNENTGDRCGAEYIWNCSFDKSHTGYHSWWEALKAQQPATGPTAALEAKDDYKAKIAELLELTDDWGTMSTPVVAGIALGVRSVALEIAALTAAPEPVPAGECTCAERGCDMAGDCGGRCGCSESGHEWDEPRHHPDAKYIDDILCKCCGEKPVQWVDHNPTQRCSSCATYAQPEPVCQYATKVLEPCVLRADGCCATHDTEWPEKFPDLGFDTDEPPPAASEAVCGKCGHEHTPEYICTYPQQGQNICECDEFQPAEASSAVCGMRVEPGNGNSDRCELTVPCENHPSASPDGIVYITPKLFDELLEYSTSKPTGTMAGKQWKRKQLSRKCEHCGQSVQWKHHSDDESVKNAHKFQPVEEWFRGTYSDPFMKDGEEWVTTIWEPLVFGEFQPAAQGGGA